MIKKYKKRNIEKFYRKKSDLLMGEVKILKNQIRLLKKKLKLVEDKWRGKTGVRLTYAYLNSDKSEGKKNKVIRECTHK